MLQDDVYKKLAIHISALAMGLPYRRELEAILREVFTPKEVEVALALPTKVIPLQPVGVAEIIGKTNLPEKELVEVLEDLTKRGLLFSGKTKDGKKGYALLQTGFGLWQTFFWKGEKTAYAKRMAELISEYATRDVTKEGYGGVKTRAFQFIPVKEALQHMKHEGHHHEKIQTVFPYEMMEGVVGQARVISLSHCSCRIRAQLLEGGCDHLVEVCMKFNELAEDLIVKGAGREISKEEALEVIKKSEEDGLVHFIDNVRLGFQHNCNCCGCCCVFLARVAKREIPRDLVIATYFIQDLDEEKCNGCGKCIDICPVGAITIKEDLMVVDKDWCVGCGLCTTKCETKATRVVRRPGLIPPPNFVELHERILREKGLA